MDLLICLLCYQGRTRGGGGARGARLFRVNRHQFHSNKMTHVLCKLSQYSIPDFVPIPRQLICVHIRTHPLGYRIIDIDHILYDEREKERIHHQAQRCLTSVIGREPVYSTWYGRRHSNVWICHLYKRWYHVLFGLKMRRKNTWIKGN